MKKKIFKKNNSKPDSFKTRKEKRKESRKVKKVNKHQHYLKVHSKKFKQEFENSNENVNQGKRKKKNEDRKNNINKKNVSSTNKQANKGKKFQSIFDERIAEKAQEKNNMKLLDKNFRKQRVESFKLENEKEERVIKSLEKKLHLNKKKNKAGAFATDGLDYVLEIFDDGFVGDETEKVIKDGDKDLAEDLAVVTENKKKNSKKNLKSKKTADESEDDVEESDEEVALSDGENLSDEEDLSEGREFLDEFAEEGEEEEDDEMEEEEDDDDDDGEEEEYNEEDIDSSDFSVDDDPDYVTPKKRKNAENEPKLKTKKRKILSDSEESDKEEPGNEISMDEESGNDNNDEELEEDIYGRLKDKKGNVVNAYKPPQLRNLVNNKSEKNSEKIQRLKRQLKGMLNRLAENNMGTICSQVEALYMANSRNDMNETLCELFYESLISEVLTPERLITEHAMLVAILHGNIGSEVSAHFLQHMVTNLDKLLKEDLHVEDKRVNNLLLFIMHLYNFRIFHSQLMYDIIDKLLEKLEEKQIELVLLVFRTVGFTLRKDDPVALKSLVLKVQEKANAVSTDDKGSRVKFMLEMVLAIKNNNMSKIPNYNPELAERLRKSLKVLIRKGNFTSELKISLADLLNAEKHGRWWIVGSAWSGSAPTEHNASKTDEKPSAINTFSQKLLDLAKKQRMNTDVRRNIFCILMSAEDYLEAFEKLLKLGLKGAVEREIMNVLIHCALQEKEFNPYYHYLANKFCTYDRKYQMMLQYAVWDKIKDLENSHSYQVTNLAKFLGHVILGKGMPISVLKVIEFAEMNKTSVKFIRQVLLTILLSNDKEEIILIFRKIAKSDKLKIFREGLRLFLHHFVLRNMKNIPEESVSVLKEMVDVADKVLSATDFGFVF